MTSEDFLTLWHGCDGITLRQLIVDFSKTFTRNIQQQEALVFVAWTAIGTLDGGKDAQYYFYIACRRMNWHYTLYMMPKPKRKISDDAGRQRVKRRFLKLFHD